MLPPGQILNNRYRIVRLLGQGGFGAVYRAWDTTFDLACAIKENTESTPEGQRQFLREARMLRTLRHPNLPLVTDYFVVGAAPSRTAGGDDNTNEMPGASPGIGSAEAAKAFPADGAAGGIGSAGAPKAFPADGAAGGIGSAGAAKAFPADGAAYLVMDFVEGDDLDVLLRRNGGPLPESQALAWITQVCEALSYLHGQNPPVIHRDIKPANIKITPEGRAMLVDFGIAKVYNPSLRTTLGARAVTPGFSPLEQYGMSGQTEARSDIYALGATLYALLTGQPPDEATQRTPARLLRSPRSLNPQISPRVDAAVMKALEMFPDGRHASAADFQRALVGEGEVVQRAAPPQVSTARVVDAPAVQSRPASGPAPRPISPQAQPASSRPPSTVRAPAASPASTVMPGRKSILFVVGAVLAGLLVVIAFAGALLALRSNNGVAPIDATQTGQAVIISQIQGTRTALAVPSTLPAGAQPAVTQALQPTVPALPAGAPATIVSRFAPMALIPAGSFEMGSQTVTALRDQRPTHRVELSAFYIDVYEVSNSLYGVCVWNKVCTPPDNENWNRGIQSRYPVVDVDWDQARTFCEEWRGGRLPTEAEWEKAARGGLEGMKYAWGDADPSCEKSAENGAQYAKCGSITAIVGSFAPNGYGLFDMTGNAAEWVSDWYADDYYATSPAVNPTGPETGRAHVFRGGSAFNFANFLTVAYRQNAAPAESSSATGFRCAQTQ